MSDSKKVPLPSMWQAVFRPETVPICHKQYAKRLILEFMAGPHVTTVHQRDLVKLSITRLCRPSGPVRYYP